VPKADIQAAIGYYCWWARVLKLWSITHVKLPRRRFLHLAACAALPAMSRIARAETYPSRPVRIIVGYAAGGPTDISARLEGQWLSERLRQSFVIDNRPGAASNISTELVVRALPDGYTLLQVGASCPLCPRKRTSVSKRFALFKNRQLRVVSRSSLP